MSNVADLDDFADHTMSRISAFVETRDRLRDANTKLNDAMDRIPPALMRRARVMVGFLKNDDGTYTPSYAETSADLTATIEAWQETLRQTGGDEHEISTVGVIGELLHLDLHRDRERIVKASDAAGVPEAADEYNSALVAHRVALEAVSKAKPDSLRSAHALAQFVAAQVRNQQEIETYAPVALNLERTLAEMAGYQDYFGHDA